MDANVGDHIRHFNGMGSSSLNPVGKRTFEWDLNDWKWDGDLFVASPLNCKPSSYKSHQLLPETGGSSNSSSTCSDNANMGSDGTREQELSKSIRGVAGECGEAGNLSLKLGGHRAPGGETDGNNSERGSGKKCKAVGVAGGNRAVCQVEDCGADLSKAKDYHRRHKVCEMHSKASRALVGNVMQRFCQQCSRFHALPEFDEGKRSCRRRLAGHNKRRRKTNPLSATPGTSITSDQSNSYLLLTLLKILADLHGNRSDQTNYQDMSSQLLRSLSENQDANRVTTNISEAVSALLSNGQQGLSNHGEQLTAAVQEMPQKGSPSADVSLPPSTLVSIKDSPPGYSVAPSTTVGRIKPKSFDLNDVCVDSDDGTEDLEGFHIPANNGTSSPGGPSWMQQDVHTSSPPQVSRNSDSGSAQSPLSSSGGDQIRTDRIVFKLFGKEPSDFPLVLRTQILDWLAHTPTDIESYIRPGCIVLTIYLRLAESVWDELCLDLTSSLSRLVDISEDSFWSTGWVYVRAQDKVAFIYNGHVVIDTTLPYIHSASRILSVKPIATPISEKVSFSIKGLNVSSPNLRLLCALEGQYLAQENISEPHEVVSGQNGSDKLQVVLYSCSIPTNIGRGFIEIEDGGLGNDFYPFIVAESDICSEIRMLESTLEVESAETDETRKDGEPDARSEAIDFIQEMGWLLRKSQMRFRSELSGRTEQELFAFDRLKWLMEFALDREWCAVVKKLLNIVFDGTVGSGEHETVIAAVADMGILHRAVRRNSRPLVELLIKYTSEGTSNGSVLKEGEFLFTPSDLGPAGLTPLHIAAGRDGAEAVLDALTDDPEMVGIEAWKNARDSTGASPEEYARLRGHYSYIHLVQRKISKNSSAPSHVVLDIPNSLISDSKPNKTESTITQKSSFQITKFPMRTGQGPCKICDQKLIYRTVNTYMAYKPAMLSMVAVAAVCVCVALLFKSCPEVLYVFHPFRWENLEYGSS